MRDLERQVIAGDAVPAEEEIPVELIPNWRAWYKRWSTWLLASAGAISGLMTFMPSVQEYIAPETYKMIMLGLSVATFFALQVKQASVSGPSA